MRIERQEAVAQLIGEMGRAEAAAEAAGDSLTPAEAMDAVKASNPSLFAAATAEDAQATSPDATGPDLRQWEAGIRSLMAKRGLTRFAAFQELKTMEAALWHRLSSPYGAGAMR